MAIGAEVFLWGTKIGTVIQNDMTDLPRFSYDNSFSKSGIELSPIVMPLSSQVYSFPNLNEKTFRGLPGLLSDSLPDKFGTRMIEVYLSKQGRSAESLTAVERLCYVGSRGMGALEFVPQLGMGIPDQTIDIDDLAKLADEILSDRRNVRVDANENAIEQLIKVGTSAGGARAKALIAWNEETRDIRSGQIDAGDGYSYWLLKFGTVENNKDKDAKADDMEYSKIEYAYSLMTLDAGIDMTECRLLKSKKGTHFITRRFDRDAVTGRKIHLQSLGGLAHFDFNDPGAHSYEQAAQMMRRIHLSQNDVEQLFRRMVFNEVSKNYDDHVKNISFLMDRQGKWSLAPAYDMTFSYNSDSIWTSKHQMKINGKRENLSLDDLIACGQNMNISNKKIKDIMQSVIAVVREWPRYAEYAGVSERNMEQIKGFHKYSGYYLEYIPTLSVLTDTIKKNPVAYTALQ